MVDLARKNLLHDKLRFFITASGVAFAVMLILFQIGLFMGLLSNATVTIEHLGADIWITSRNTPNVDFAHAFPESRVDRVRSVPGVARADNLIVAFIGITLPTGAEETSLVYAMEDFSAWNFPWKITEGNAADLRRGDYVILDDSAKKRYGPFQVGEYREYLGNRLKIIGRTMEAKSFTTNPVSFMDYRVAQRIAAPLRNGQTTYVLVKLEPGADREAVMAELRRRLPYNDVYASESWAQRSLSYWIKSTGIGFNMFLTIFLGCLVGVVVVAQTLYTSTMEHLKEFGTVKAIGGSNRDIYLILCRQALISAVTGFTLGCIPAFIARELVQRVDLKIIISPLLLGSVAVGTVVMCLAAAMLSFRKVASIDPALVFRT